MNEVVDWPNLIEEVADLGGSELRACRSVIAQLVFHLGELKAFPNSQAADHWDSEINGFLSQLQSHFAPSMATRIDLPRLYGVAMRQLSRSRERSAHDFPASCPFSLHDLVSEDANLTDLLAKLDPPS